MRAWLTAELVLAVLVALCGVFILAGAVKLLGRGGGQRCPGSEKRDSDRNGSA